MRSVSSSFFDPRSLFAWLLVLLSAVFALADDRDSNREYHFRHLGIEDGLSHPAVHCILQDLEGFLWFGTSDGLSRYDGFEILAFRPSRRADSEVVFPVKSLSQDSSGLIWIAAGGQGLYRFDPHSRKFHHVALEVPGSELHPARLHLLEVSSIDDVTWVGTKNSGLLRYDAAKSETKHYTLVPGEKVQVESIVASAKHSGRLWLGTRTHGLLLFDPDLGTWESHSRMREATPGLARLGPAVIDVIEADAFAESQPPAVALSDFKISGEHALRRGSITVTHEQNRMLAFEFTAFDYSAPEANRYTWILDGFDKDWHPVSPTRQAVYTSLPAGDFTLRIKAANSDGVWNEAGLSIGLTILPPWWATWWFRSGGAIAILGLTGGTVRWRNRRIREQNEILAVGEQRYQNLLANTSELLWCIEFDEPVSLDLAEMEQVERLFNARVVECNEAFARSYGATTQEALNWHVEDFIPRSLSTSVPFLLEAVRSRFRMEDLETIEQSTEGKTKVFINSFMGTIEDGRVLRVWGMCRDVTETREIEKQIRLRQAAIESTHDGFVIADATEPGFPLVFVNERFQQFTGYSEDEILGRNCRFLQGADTDPNTIEAIRTALNEEERFQGELLNYRKDGTPFWSFLRISPVHDRSGKLTHFVGMSTDITERVRTEELSQQQRDQLEHVSRAATLVEIGAALAHELNQPLAAILRNAQAAQRFLDTETPNHDELREILADIIKDDRRAGDVLKRIRQQLSKDASERTSVNLNEVVKDALALLSHELIIKHTEIKLDLSEELPPVLADPIQIQQVMLNLVLNAEDAMESTPPGQSKITVSTTVQGDFVQVSVSDAGHGIPPDQLESIFEPFHTTKNSGMGVGLSINRTIVDSHDGKMWAENVAAGGARMIFSLPILTHAHD
ncbi:Sensor protein FixL [Planctomycetes bacterium CA13]|uniref:histidine kinase n=1 Tax=Novipirellula herctigrandis TaxID=2527986 RepID=A0A5C5YP63_9BACT|nr:Sensor protein FixL [Planctomycetes bacterium CA13]